MFYSVCSNRSILWIMNRWGEKLPSKTRLWIIRKVKWTPQMVHKNIYQTSFRESKAGDRWVKQVCFLHQRTDVHVTGTLKSWNLSGIKSTSQTIDTSWMSCGHRISYKSKLIYSICWISIYLDKNLCLSVVAAQLEWPGPIKVYFSTRFFRGDLQRWPTAREDHDPSPAVDTNVTRPEGTPKWGSSSRKHLQMVQKSFILRALTNQEPNSQNITWIAHNFKLFWVVLSLLYESRDSFSES